MPASVVEYLLSNKPTISKIIDITQQDLTVNPNGVLERFFPLKSYQLLDMVIANISKSKPTVGNIIARGQEIPISSDRATLSVRNLADFKVGKQYMWTEEDFMLMEKMRLYADSSLASEIEDYIFGKVAELVPAIIQRLTSLVFKIITTGSCDFTDPITGVKVNFAYDNTSPTLLLSALTSTARWNQPSTSNALQNLQDHVRAYYDLFNSYPSAIMMRQANLDQIGAMLSTKTAWYQDQGTIIPSGADISTTYLREEQVISLIRSRTKNAEIIIFDTKYTEEQANGSIIEYPLLADNTYLLLEEGNVERGLLPTIESGIDGTPRAGVYTLDEVVRKVPREERSVGVANVMPIVFDARKLASRRVV